MAVLTKVYDKHSPGCQTNISRLAMFAQQSEEAADPATSPPPVRPCSKSVQDVHPRQINVFAACITKITAGKI